MMSDINIVIPENFAVNEADEVREKVNGLIDKGDKNFTFDFSRCTFIDSTGLGVLVAIYKKCNELKGHFKLESVNNPQVLKVFKLTRLDKVFGI